MASRPLVVHVVGARPNYMKVAPVYAELERRENLEQRLIHTGQHYDALMKDVFFAELPLPRPHIALDAQTIDDALIELERVLAELRPDLVVVAGDVNSTLAAAVAATKRGLMVCHIESGLRSNDWHMPEERNRVVTDHLSRLLLTYSEVADANLADEGIPNKEQMIERVGNTMIDTLRANEQEARGLEAWRQYGLEPQNYVLVTLHRPSLVDVPELLRRTVDALNDLATSLPVIFPIHPRTRKMLDQLGVEPKFTVVPPLPYRAFISLEADAAAVITDSGGIQEETTVLGVPCFTLRDNTERPETLNGTNTLLKLEPESLRDIPSLLAQPKPGEIPELWDGRAGERAADAVEEILSQVEVTA
ncbi:MAG: UDP-N-acetylglucosamine 2-epimerase (non-hydrolyzing) [Actinomycetota bacterium]|nr:UDP-N-acetylglucosamine 2-epimerase (non-hydrolyzing) [Actinomycetota bacterium]